MKGALKAIRQRCQRRENKKLSPIEHLDETPPQEAHIQD
jgi:hypothetical protein